MPVDSCRLKSCKYRSRFWNLGPANTHVQSRVAARNPMLIEPHVSFGASGTGAWRGSSHRGGMYRANSFLPWPAFCPVTD